MDPITARILSQAFGIGVGGPVAPEPGGAGFEFDDSQDAQPMNIPAAVAPTPKAEQKLRTSHTMNSSYQRGGGSGMPQAPAGWDPQLIENLMKAAPTLAAPMITNIHDQYAPIHEAISQYGNLTPDQLPPVPGDPMANPMQAAASMGLGRWGSILQGMPERGGEAAQRVERGIQEHQKGLENVAQVRRETKRKQEEMHISATSAEVADKLKAQDTAFQKSVDAYALGKNYDKDIYSIGMDAYNSAEQRKVALQIAQWQRDGDKDKADLAINARSAISYASAEIMRKAIVDKQDPEDMDITFPVPGAPGDPTKGVPPGFQSVHGVSQLDQRIIGSLQSIEDEDVRGTLTMMYTSAISDPLYKIKTKKTEKDALHKAANKKRTENMIKAVTAKPGTSPMMKTPL